MGSLGEFFSAIASGLVVTLYSLFSERAADRKKREILRKHLSDERWKWRTIKRLRNAIREDEPTTRRLLAEMGARASTGDKEVWTLDRDSQREESRP
jgi:hypothetical protein